MILTASRKIRGWESSARRELAPSPSPPLQVRPALLRKTLMQTQIVTHTQPQTCLLTVRLVGRAEAERVRTGRNGQSGSGFGITASPGLYKLDPRAEPGGCEWLLATLAVIAIDHRIVIESGVFSLELESVLQRQSLVLMMSAKSDHHQPASKPLQNSQAGLPPYTRSSTTRILQSPPWEWSRCVPRPRQSQSLQEMVWSQMSSRCPAIKEIAYILHSRLSVD